MKSIKALTVICLVSAAYAVGVLADPDSVSEITIPAGKLTVTDGKVLLNGDSIFHESSTYLYDFGDAGVLVKSSTGGQRCRFSYQIIDPESGTFRSLREGADRDTVFAECQRLHGVVSDLSIAIMAPQSANEYGRVHTWNGRTMAETILDRIDDTTAIFDSGDEVLKWIGQSPFDFLEDSAEANRLSTVLSNEELASVRSAIFKAGSISEQDGFILVSGSNEDFFTWAAIAVRIADGQPFVVWDDGKAMPEGEILPAFLSKILESGKLP